MKYFYLICLTLSSLFTYKPSFAEIYHLQHAFFIPENAFQHNNTTAPDIAKMRPRHKQQKEEVAVAPAAQAIQQPRPIKGRKKIQPVQQPMSFQKASSATTSAPDNTITEALSINTPSVIEAQSTPPSVDTPHETDLSAIQEIAAQYTLEEPTPTQNTAQATPALVAEPSLFEKLAQEDLNALLSRIPFPDYKQPKFKQLYSIYGLELRSLRERGKLPDNLRQEEVLSKANSLLRFKVQ